MKKIVIVGGGFLGAYAAKRLQRTFDVTSTGQVNQTMNLGFKVSETIKAVVFGAPGAALLEIIDWDEGEQNIQ